MEESGLTTVVNLVLSRNAFLTKVRFGFETWQPTTRREKNLLFLFQLQIWELSFLSNRQECFETWEHCFPPSRQWFVNLIMRFFDGFCSGISIFGKFSLGNRWDNSPGEMFCSLYMFFWLLGSEQRIQGFLPQQLKDFSFWADFFGWSSVEGYCWYKKIILCGVTYKFLGILSQNNAKNAILLQGFNY